MVAIQIPHLIQSNDAFGHKKPTRAFNLQIAVCPDKREERPIEHSVQNYGIIKQEFDSTR